MRIDEYASYDATGLAQLVAARQVRPSEIAEVALDAIARVDPELSAVVEIYPDALDRARALDDRPLGTLTGVPMVRKDIGATEAGKGIELGSRLAEGLVAYRESNLVAAFKAAGLVIVGRSATSEMGCYATVESAARGTTRNPWMAGHTSGGSSGGSAALVASGALPVGHANDGAGSIRIPASCCGLVGLKPSRGRVSSGPGSGEANFGGAVELVVTRTVRDTAAVLDAVAGPRPGDPFRIPEPDVTFVRAAATPPAPLRIGWTVEPWGPTTVDPEVADAVRRTAATLEAAGHQVEEAAFPLDWDRFVPAFVDLWAAGVASSIPPLAERMGRPMTEEFLEPVTLAWLDRCRRLGALDVTHALADVNRLARAGGRYFERFDVLMTPTLATLPVPFGTIDGNHPGVDARGNADALLAFDPYCPLFNLTGQPALTLPLAPSRSGLPIGVHLVGPHASEATLLALGGQLEAAMPWAARRPAVHVSNR